MSLIIGIIVFLILATFFIGMLVTFVFAKHKKVVCPNCENQVKLVGNKIKCPRCKVKLFKDTSGEYRAQ
jgi:Zn finger protein HypA/HybF involved in hydrogenase expression